MVTKMHIMLDDHEVEGLRYLKSLGEWKNCSNEDVIHSLLFDFLEVEVEKPIRRKQVYGHELTDNEKRLLGLFGEHRRVKQLYHNTVGQAGNTSPYTQFYE